MMLLFWYQIVSLHGKRSYLFIIYYKAYKRKCQPGGDLGKQKSLPKEAFLWVKLFKLLVDEIGREELVVGEIEFVVFLCRRDLAFSLRV